MGKFLELLVGELKVKNVKVFLQTLGIQRFGNDNHASVYVPSQEYLCRSFAILLFANLNQGRIVQLGSSC